MNKMNGNLKVFAAVMSAIILFAGFVLGSMNSQLSNQEKFVPKAQYYRDISDIKDLLGELRSDIKKFHMEDRRSGR